MNDNRMIVIDINLSRGLMIATLLAVLAIVLFGYLATAFEDAAASKPISPSVNSGAYRQYYLSKVPKDGTEVDTACAQGYHFASLWEILDTSNLRYNLDLGAKNLDGGQGPPTSGGGWIRTGYTTSDSGGAGKANCKNWSETNATGSSITLASDWTTGGEMGPWKVDSINCDTDLLVWCVED